MAKNWKILPQKSDNLLEQLLLNRGLKTKQQREQFFHPKLSEFEADLNIPNISKAKKRIEQAIKNQELIIVYGDYDVDGICGAAVLYLGLSELGAKVLPYLPHREKEGYGLSPVGLNYAKEQGASLVISVDCGIVSFEQAKLVKKLGMDLIITDHHQPLGDKRPDCFALVHSTKMCGTAVAWCLMRSLLNKSQQEELLDLVAIATIADMMPLLGVNRAFVKEGLKVLNQTERIGWKALFNEAGVKRGEITAYEIGHIIAPRLNAMGRLGHAIDSLRLICTRDRIKASRLANLVAETNNQRKKLTEDAITSARLEVAKELKKIYVVASEEWAPGIIGLIAGRITEETKRPSIAISIGETHSKGSARSINGVNITELIRKCSDLLVAVGGHTGASGFTIFTEKIQEFRERLEGFMEEEMELEESELEIEAEVKSNKLSMNLAKDIAKFEPFGKENQMPILCSQNMILSELITLSEGKHLKGKADNVDFIAFGMGDLKNLLQDGMLIDMAYNLEINKFNGREKLQLKVKDIKLV